MNFYLIMSGILSSLLSVAHAVWGEKYVIKESELSKVSNLTKVAFRISWHQISSLFFITGIFSFILGLREEIDEAFKYFILFVLLITTSNFIIFLIFMSLKAKDSLKMTVPQVVLFLVLIGLKIMGYLSI